MTATINPLYSVVAALSVMLIIILLIGIVTVEIRWHTFSNFVRLIFGAYEDEEEYDAEWMDYDKWRDTK